MESKAKTAGASRAIAALAAFACAVTIALAPGEAVAESGLAQGAANSLTVQAAELAEGQEANVAGVLVRKEAHMNVDPGMEGTNIVYYVIELDEAAVADASGDSLSVTSVQVGRVMSGARSQQALTPFSEMGDSQLEPLVGKAVSASGTFTVYGGTFMWTPYQLADATVRALGDPASEQAMYRLYNRWSGEHFYTADEGERAGLRDAGWFYEGVGWVAPGSSASPVYRLYNPYAGEHHYMLDDKERGSLIAAGWTDEGVGWYSADEGAIPVYREYNPNEPANNHNYTADRAEHDGLVALGWTDEGVGWRALDADAEDPHAREAAEDREALRQAEADAQRQAAVDAALAAGKYVFAGTVRVAKDVELMGEMGENLGGTSDMLAVLMFDEPQSVTAPQMGMLAPVTRAAKNIALDYQTWKDRAGEHVTLAFDSVRYPGGVMYAWLFADSAPQAIAT